MKYDQMKDKVFAVIKQYKIPILCVIAAIAIVVAALLLHSNGNESTDPSGKEHSSVNATDPANPGDDLPEIPTGPVYTDVMPTDKESAARLLCDKIRLIALEKRTKAVVRKYMEFSDFSGELTEEQLKQLNEAASGFANTIVTHSPEISIGYGGDVSSVLPAPDALASPGNYTAQMDESGKLTLCFAYGKSEAQNLFDKEERLFTDEVLREVAAIAEVKNESIVPASADVTALINENSGLLERLEVRTVYQCTVDAVFAESLKELGACAVGFTFTENRVYTFTREGIFFRTKKATVVPGESAQLLFDVYLPETYQNETYVLRFVSSAPDVLTADAATGTVKAVSPSSEPIDVVAVLKLNESGKVYQDICKITVAENEP